MSLNFSCNPNFSQIIFTYITLKGDFSKDFTNSLDSSINVLYLCIDKYNRFMKYKLQQETKPKLSRGARVHFIPESIDGVQDLYDGIEYER